MSSVPKIIENADIDRDTPQPEIHVEERRLGLHDFLKTAVKINGSDIHLQAGSIPMIRVDGRARFLDVPAVNDDLMKEYVDQIINAQAEPSEQHHEQQPCTKQNYAFTKQGGRFHALPACGVRRFCGSLERKQNRSMAPGMLPGGREDLEARPVTRLRTLSLQISPQRVPCIGEVLCRKAVRVGNHQGRRGLTERTGMKVCSQRLHPPLRIDIHVDRHSAAAGW